MSSDTASPQKNLARMAGPFGWLVGALIVVLFALMQFVVSRDTRIDRSGMIGDAREYTTYAINLRTLGVYSQADGVDAPPQPDAIRPPGYPLFVAIFVDPAARLVAVDAIVWVQSALNLVALLAWLRIFWRVLPSPWWIAAGLLTASSPHLLNLPVYVVSESLFTALLALHLMCLCEGWPSRSLRWIVSGGLILALASLLRPTVLYLPLAYVALIALGRWDRRTKLAACLGLLLPLAAVSGAWSMRNLAATGQTSDPTLQANFLQHGMYINMMYNDDPRTYLFPYRFDPENAALQGDTRKVLAAIATRFASNPPRYLAWLMIGKPALFFSWDLTESVGGAFIYEPLASPWVSRPIFKGIYAAHRAIHPGVILLALAAALVHGARLPFSWRSANDTSFQVVGILVVVYLYFLLFHIVGAPYPRYSVPLRPICFVLAVFALQSAVSRLRVRRDTSMTGTR